MVKMQQSLSFCCGYHGRLKKSAALALIAWSPTMHPFIPPHFIPIQLPLHFSGSRKSKKMESEANQSNLTRDGKEEGKKVRSSSGSTTVGPCHRLRSGKRRKKRSFSCSLSSLPDAAADSKSGRSGRRKSKTDDERASLVHKYSRASNGWTSISCRQAFSLSLSLSLSLSPAFALGV